MMDTKILKALQEINLEMRDELAATADFIEKTIRIADKYGKDRTTTMEIQCAMMLTLSAATDFDTYKRKNQKD